MTESIARQSVIIKCNLQKSVMLGNYEFYYAAGLLRRLHGVQVSEDLKPQELLEQLHRQMQGLTPKDDKESYLFQMIKNYEPLEEYNEQMQRLFRWGESERDMWKVQTKMEA